MPRKRPELFSLFSTLDNDLFDFLRVSGLSLDNGENLELLSSKNSDYNLLYREFVIENKSIDEVLLDASTISSSPEQILALTKHFQNNPVLSKLIYEQTNQSNIIAIYPRLRELYYNQIRQGNKSGVKYKTGTLLRDIDFFIYINYNKLKNAFIDLFPNVPHQNLFSLKVMQILISLKDLLQEN